ncbi:HAMP domain-containing histidine kinase [bacterium]|nr:HAMP domain-containing histidine kinase [bacterium]
MLNNKILNFIVPAIFLVAVSLFALLNAMDFLVVSTLMLLFPVIVSSLRFGAFGSGFSSLGVFIFLTTYRVASSPDADLPKTVFTAFITAVIYFSIGLIVDYVKKLEAIAQKEHTELEKAISNLEAHDQKSYSLAKDTEKAKAIERLGEEINSPLALISGHLELLKTKLESEKYFALPKDRLKSDLARHFRSLENSKDKITDLVKEITTPEYKEKKHTKTISLGVIIEKIREEFEALCASKRIILKIEPLDQDRSVTINENKFLVAFRGLMENSIESLEKAQMKWISIHLEAREHFIYLEVEDCGEGIRPEDQERIFRPFFSTKDQKPGLGLSYAKELMKELGGDVTLDSTTPKKGSKFLLKYRLLGVLEKPPIVTTGT